MPSRPVRWNAGKRSRREGRVSGTVVDPGPQPWARRCELAAAAGGQAFALSRDDR